MKGFDVQHEVTSLKRRNESRDGSEKGSLDVRYVIQETRTYEALEDHQILRQQEKSLRMGGYYCTPQWGRKPPRRTARNLPQRALPLNEH